MQGAISFLFGAALGWIHLRLYERMLGALLEKPEGAPFRFLAVKAGVLRHFLTFAAGILMIREAKLDPFHFCGGLLIATVLYRIHLIFWAKA